MKITYFRIYFTLAILAAAVLSSLSYSVIAGVMLFFQLYLFWKNQTSGLSFAIDLLCIVSLPLVLNPAIPWYLSLLAVLPALPLLSEDLKRNAREQPFLAFVENKKISSTIKSILIALALLLVLSLMTATYILSFTIAILSAYLAWHGLKAFRMLSDPLSWQENVELKLIVGETKQLSVEFTNKTGKPLLVRVEQTYSWLRINKPEFEFADTALFEATVEATLAGPSTLVLELSIRDELGFLQFGYTIECAKLIMIPRATYSVWLAKKYLEQGVGAIGSVAASFITSASVIQSGSGIEYHSSHPYFPGDSFNNIDWKHTARFREIVVKKYQDMRGNAVVILANLATSSAEEADRVASNLINSVLTLSMNSVHAMLVAYNEHEVVEITPVILPNALLKRVLLLVESMSSIKPSVRYLWPPDVKKLNKTRRELANVDLESARKLLAILDIEIEAVKMASSKHPLSVALSRITSIVTPPAMLVPITSFNHDTEALSHVLPRLERQGYLISPPVTDNLTASRIGINPS